MKGNGLSQKKMAYPPALLRPYWSPPVEDHGTAVRRGWFYPRFLNNPIENPRLVKALLEHGANPYTADEHGETVLHKACIYRHTDTVKILLDYHVNPNVKTQTGNTPLTWADYNSTRLLIQYGAEVNARNDNGVTPLMWIVDPMKMQLLLDHKADVNAHDNQGRTVLANAVFLPTDTVRFLLQHGAKVSIKDHTGKTALDLANEREYEDVIPLLATALRKEQAQPDSSARTGK
jgi:uncharacterized protein